MMNEEASPIAPMSGYSAFVANRYAEFMAKKERRSTINFPMWVKTTPCSHYTQSFLAMTPHGTVRRTYHVRIHNGPIGLKRKRQGL